MEKRKTTIKRQGRGFKISFSEKDGKALAKHVRNGGALMDGSIIAGKETKEAKDE